MATALMTRGPALLSWFDMGRHAVLVALASSRASGVRQPVQDRVQMRSSGGDTDFFFEEEEEG